MWKTYFLSCYLIQTIQSNNFYFLKLWDRLYPVVQIYWIRIYTLWCIKKDKK